MTRIAAARVTYESWPPLWRLFVIALGVLILCSCRGPVGQPAGQAMVEPPCPPTMTGLPPAAYTGMPTEMALPPNCQGVPLPYQAMCPWTPPGIACPWPKDEYLCDGGDRELPAAVDQQWQVHGLETEDTIAHFDTLDGRRLVEPSNRVCIYSPRFGAVRKVVSVEASQQANRAVGVHLPLAPKGPTETQIASTTMQQLQSERQVGTKLAETFRTRWGDGAMSSADGPLAFQDALMPYENLRMIREGIAEMSEAAVLARGVDAAITWTHDQAVQVILDHQAATVETKVEQAESVYTIKAPPGDPKLRIIKIASTPFAEPGDEVAFTIRFDNVGNQTIGNVTIIDNLTTRLEYLPDTAQCSREANFFTEPNDGDSVALRCEVIDPLDPGEGGVIRFRCRVR